MGSRRGTGLQFQWVETTVQWFSKQSEGVKIGILVPVLLLGPFFLLALIQLSGRNPVAAGAILVGFGGASAIGAAVLYTSRLRRQRDEEHRLWNEAHFRCLTCSAWNPRETEYCNKCGRPFLDPSQLAEFLNRRKEIELKQRAVNLAEKQLSLQMPRLPMPAGHSGVVEGRPVHVNVRAGIGARGVLQIIAATKSYTGNALVVLLLYLFLCWPIGAIMNVLWLSEANRMYRMSGVAPDGRGFLQVLAWIFIIIPFVIAILVVLWLATNARTGSHYTPAV